MPWVEAKKSVTPTVTMIRKLSVAFFLVLFVNQNSRGSARELEPRVGPYVDIMLPGPTLEELAEKTGIKYFTVAFALGGSAGCEPFWGGEKPLNHSEIIDNIRGLQKKGGQVAVALGGALGPYLESICGSVESLAKAYIKILDTVKTDHLDIDIEASVPLDTVTKALKQVQDKRPDTTVRLTLMVQGDDYGLTPELGVKLLEKARDNGLRVDVVNPMTMEFGTTRKEWGEAVIASLEATHGQMKKIWPSKSSQELYAMLGATPMIGRNFNGKIFTQAHAKDLVEYATKKNLGYIGFWSVGRDNGDCPGGGISPKCSSIQQNLYEFSKIFNQYSSKPGKEEMPNEIEHKNHSKTTKQPKNPNDSSKKPVTAPTSTSSTSRTSTTSTTSTTQEPEVVLGEKRCRGFETRFHDWCDANCRANFCPDTICTCETIRSKNKADPPEEQKISEKYSKVATKEN